MKVRQNLKRSGLEHLFISDDICQSVVQTSLKRSSTLNIVCVMFEAEDIAVVVEELALFDLLPLHFVNQVISDFDDLVTIVNMAFNKVIQV